MYIQKIRNQFKITKKSLNAIKLNNFISNIL